jgi:glycosyltransferase involved in cell wall biosynthesis
VHTQDVVLGAVLNGRVEAGRRGCPVILAHGTDETIETLKAFRYLQHLSPAHRDKAAEALGGMVMKDEADTDSKRRAEGPLHFCIPNFVDVDQFRPAGEGGADAKRAAWRRDHGIPEEALVVGCAAALKRSHKRLDVLIREVATLRTSSAPCFLLLAGASTAETPALKRTARERMGDRCMLVENAPFARMPEMYRAMDVFVLPATEEAFGICFLEAMACGVPVVAHASETSRWIVGAAGGGDAPGGWCVDMREAGFLERLWPRIETERGRKQRACRPHVVATFSWQAVRPAFLAMYAAVRRDASVPDIGSAPRVRGGGRYDR